MAYKDVWGMYRSCTDVWRSVQMYRAYRHMLDVLVAYRCMGDVQGIQMYGGMYRCIGHTGICWMYWWHTDVWGMYRVYRCMEECTDV